MRWQAPYTKLIFISSLLAVALQTVAATLAPDVLRDSQTAGAVTNFTDPGRASNDLLKKTPLLPKTNGRAQINMQQAPVTKASKLSFKLKSVKFSGNTAFSDAELMQIFAPYLNRTITLGELEDLVHKVSIKYRDSGRILSRAILPPQVIKGGTIKVRVIEGYVSGFIVKGDAGRAKGLLQNYGQHIMDARPLQIQTLQRYTLLANDLPGYTVESLLTPSENVPEGADLTFITTRKRMSAFISYDNEGTRFLGPHEVTLGGSLYSLIAPGDANNIRFTVTGRPQELRFLEIVHVQPIGSRGLRWQWGTDYAETRPQFILSAANIVGRNLLTFTDVSYPWLRDRSKNFVTHVAFNYQNVTSTILASPFYEDRIRSLVLGWTYDNVDTWHGANTYGMDLTHGFGFWGAGYHVNQSRPEAGSIYTRVNLSMSRTQALTQRFSVYAGMHSQFSFEPLLATEQFGVGGPDIGRGYDPSEIVGDQGFSAKVELRMDTYPGFRLLQAVQYYIFYDGGLILNKDSFNLPNQQSLTSTGVGARITFMPSITGQVFFGKPITRQVAVLTAQQENSTGGRVFFQVMLTL